MKIREFLSKNGNLDYAKKSIINLNRDVPYIKGKISLLLELCEIDIPQELELSEDYKEEYKIKTNEFFDLRLSKITKKLKELLDVIEEI